MKTEKFARPLPIKRKNIITLIKKEKHNNKTTHPTMEWSSKCNMHILILKITSSLTATIQILFRPCSSLYGSFGFNHALDEAAIISFHCTCPTIFNDPLMLLLIVIGGISWIKISILITILTNTTNFNYLEKYNHF